MEQSELIALLCGVLDRLALPYFLTGSVASSFFGEPRFTNDIDVVVQLPESRVREFCSAFPSSDFYVSVDAAMAAVRSKTQFNIILPDSGLKVDVMIPDDTPFNLARFERTARYSPGGAYAASLASMEDVIIKKMEYYREGGSEKHLRDITSILLLNREKVDRAYIDSWAATLGLTEIWNAIIARIST